MNRVPRGPAMLLFHPRHERKPAGQREVTVPTWAIFHIRFQMKLRVCKLAMPGALNFRQMPHEDLGFARHDLRKQPVSKTGEEFRVPREKTAIEQGENRLRIIRI